MLWSLIWACFELIFSVGTSMHAWLQTICFARIERSITSLLGFANDPYIHLQKRNMKTNVSLVMLPVLLCTLIVVLEVLVNSQLDQPRYKCGCKCVETNSNGRCHEYVCGWKYSTAKQAPACAIPRPQPWPAMLQVPGHHSRAVHKTSQNFAGLPNASCLSNGACPVTSLFTGQNISLAHGMSHHLRKYHVISSNYACTCYINWTIFD